MFKAMKYCVNPRFFSQTQENGEEIAPGANNPSYLPDLLTVKKSDAAQLEARKQKEDDQGNSTKEGSSNDDWLTKLSKAEKKRKIEAGIEDKSKKAKKSKIKPGVYVYTRDMHIAVKSKSPKQGGSRRFRYQCKGTVMKPSAYYHKVWVVKFDDGRTLSVSEALLYFISKTSPTHRLVRDENINLSLEKIDKSFEDKEAILDVILNSKIHCTIGHDQVTYENLVKLFKPQYRWLTASKLRKHVSVTRRLLAINDETKTVSNKTGTWISQLPDPEVGECKDQDDTEDIITKSFNGTNTKFAGQNHGSNKDTDEAGTGRSLDDDNIENHGLACTCCGVRSNVVTDADLQELQTRSLETGCHAMIVRVVRSVDGSNRTCTITAVPKSSSKVNNNDFYSDDTETKHTKYVSNSYTTIDSSEEAVGTSELVDNADNEGMDNGVVLVDNDEGKDVGVDTNEMDVDNEGIDDGVVLVDKDESKDVGVDTNEMVDNAEDDKVGVTEGMDDGAHTDNNKGKDVDVDTSEMVDNDDKVGATDIVIVNDVNKVGHTEDNPIIIDDESEENEG